MVTITVYQPIAGILGHKKPGGFKFSLCIEEQITLVELFKLNEEYGEDLIKNLAGEPPKVMVTIAINGNIRRDGLLTQVNNGDEVSVLPVYLGG